MVVSSRALAAIGLGLVGFGVLVAPSLGQQAKQDGAVRATSSRPATPLPPNPPVFGSIELGPILKGYDKFKFLQEEFQAAALSKQRELMQIAQEGKQQTELLAKFTAGSFDFKKAENKITELKAKMEAGREQAQRDFALRESEMFATVYKDINSMVARVAKSKGMTYVLRVSNDPIAGSDPDSAMSAMQRTVVYADPSNDITKDVIHYLNVEYKAKNGPAPKSATSAANTQPTGKF